MKKWIGLIALFIGLPVISHAGNPVQTYYSGQAPLGNTSIWGSTSTTNGSINISASILPVAGAGAASTSCRVCLNKFIVQVPTTTVVTILGSRNH